MNSCSCCIWARYWDQIDQYMRHMMGQIEIPYRTTKSIRLIYNPFNIECLEYINTSITKTLLWIDDRNTSICWQNIPVKLFESKHKIIQYMQCILNYTVILSLNIIRYSIVTMKLKYIRLSFLEHDEYIWCMFGRPNCNIVLTFFFRNRVKP